jgi:hypothetical protein
MIVLYMENDMENDMEKMIWKIFPMIVLYMENDPYCAFYTTRHNFKENDQ